MSYKSKAGIWQISWCVARLMVWKSTYCKILSDFLESRQPAAFTMQLTPYCFITRGVGVCCCQWVMSLVSESWWLYGELVWTLHSYTLEMCTRGSKNEVSHVLIKPIMNKLQYGYCEQSFKRNPLRELLSDFGKTMWVWEGDWDIFQESFYDLVFAPGL